MLRDLLRKAQSAAERHLPESVRETGRKLAEQVQGRAPASLQRLVKTLRGDDDEPPPDEPSRPDEAAARDQTGVVVVFAYPDDAAADRISALLSAANIPFRRMNLHDQPQAAKQIARVTGVMAPPYVYIRGRFWGGEGEIAGLHALGELAAVVAGDLSRLSDEARRIGKLREEFDDALNADNIVARLHKGHILSLDDLDCWYESGPDGQGRFYYEGAPRPIEDLAAVAAEIEGRCASGELRAEWRFEPAVTI